MHQLEPGRRFGPYEILSRLGAGGMGEVWRARDTRLERSVAIKVLPAEFAGNSQLKLRFEREAKTISQLNHPHICTLYDVGRENGTDFLVMELLEGETLADRLTRGALPIEQVLKIGIQIAAALEQAHRAGIVHRDLKPGNVMLTKGGAKLLDFGLAKENEGGGAIAELTSLRTEKKNALTEEGTIVGTFQYMAPEQIEGQAVDHRTDIFAFGALLYEMATGRRAFHGKSKASLIASILTTDPPSIAAVQPLTPPSLDRLVHICLEKEPEDRWQSAHDVRLELQAIAEAGSQAAIAAPAVSRRKKREWVAWSLAALMAIAVVALGLQLLRDRAQHEAANPIRTSLVLPTGFEFVPNLGEAPAISPDGKRIVFPAAVPGKSRVLLVRSLDSLAARELPGTEDGRYPFWSPDGRFVAFFADGKLKKTQWSGGSPIALCEVTEGRGGSWGSRNTIVFGQRIGPIMRVSASGGVPAATTELAADQGSHRWPRFLPDGTHFVFLASPGGGEDPNNWISVGSTAEKIRKQLVQASSQPLVFRDRLLFIRDQNLMAQRLDLEELTIVGDAVPLTEQGIEYDSLFARAVLDVSASGNVVYRAGGALRSSKLVWLDATGKESGEAGPPEAYGRIRLSPDGNTVAYSVRTGTAQRNLWVLDVRRNVKSRLTFGESVDNSPVWSPDGTRIVYSSGLLKRRVNDLYLKDLTTGAERLLVTTDRNKVPSHWSADGQTIWYTHNPLGGQGDIWYYSFADGKTHLYAGNKFGESNAVLSPDGKWLAFQTTETGNRSEIYVAPFPATGAKWQISAGGGMLARWRGDGKALLYVTPPPNTRIVLVPIAFTDRPQIGQAQTLFAFQSAFITPPAIDMTEDGKRFLLNARIGEETPQVPFTLVQHLEALLREAEEKQSP